MHQGSVISSKQDTGVQCWSVLGQRRRRWPNIDPTLFPCVVFPAKCEQLMVAMLPGGVRPSTLPLGHGGSPQYWFITSEREETFFSLKLKGQSGVRTHDIWLSKQAALTTAPGPPPRTYVHMYRCKPTDVHFTDLSSTPVIVDEIDAADTTMGIWATTQLEWTKWRIHKYQTAMNTPERHLQAQSVNTASTVVPVLGQHQVLWPSTGSLLGQHMCRVQV